MQRQQAGTSQAQVRWPTCKGLGVLIFSQCPSDTLKQIKKDFSGILRVYTTSSGSVQSQFHAEQLIPGAVAASAVRLRNLAKVNACRVWPDHVSLPRMEMLMTSVLAFLRSSQGPLLYEEDMAPSHIGDSDTATKAEGLKKKRLAALRAAKLVRRLYPINGTPDFCKND